MTDRSRRKLLLVAALFLAPLLLAALLYFVFPQWQPPGKTHHGQLVDPARPLPALRLADETGAARDATELRGKWSFIYLAGAQCADACRAKLFQIRQIRTLLNEKRLRVQRVYVAPDAAALAAARTLLAAEHPDLRFLVDGDAGLRGFFGAHDDAALYLTDPLGNWLMVYPAAAESPGILKDIKKLLRLSQIG